MVLRYILAFVLLFLSFFILRQNIQLIYVSFNNFHHLYGILIGAFFFIVLIRLPLRSFKHNLTVYYPTKIHESTHEFFIFITGRKMSGFNINGDSSGQVTYIEKGNILIILSPYFFPLLALPLIIVRFFIIDKFLLYFDIILGIVLSFHIFCFYRDTHRHQTDIKSVGYLFSFVFILFMHLINFGIIFCMLQNLSLGEYIKDIVLDIISFFTKL